MGIYATAELIWGIPVTAYDDDGEPTVYWDEDAEDWRALPGDLCVRGHGHYEDLEGPEGILTSTRVKYYHAWLGEPHPVPWGNLSVDRRDISKSNEAAREAGLHCDFLAAHWNLVASYG